MRGEAGASRPSGTPARRSARSSARWKSRCAGEPQPAALGVAEPQLLDGRCDVAVRWSPGHQARASRRRRRRSAAAAAACRSGRPGSRCPSGRRRRSRSTASSGSPRPRPRRARPASPPRASPCRGRSRGGPRAAPRRSSRSRVVYQSTSTGSPASAARPQPSSARSEKCSLQPSNRPPSRQTCLDHRADPAVAAGEQAFDDAGLAVVVAEADGLAVAAGRRGSRRAACASRASVVSWSSWAAHWNGVCGLGTKPPIDTVQRMSLRPATSRPVRMTSLASSAICSTSSSVSVGSPHMK